LSTWNISSLGGDPSTDGMFMNDACSLCEHVPLTLKTRCFEDCASARVSVGKTFSSPVIHV